MAVFRHSPLRAAALSPAVSEDYSDIIVRRPLLPQQLPEPFVQQVVDTQYSIVYAPISENLTTVQAVGYSGIPKLYTYQNTASLEASGILAAQNQPYLDLRGNGVLIGFLDSGIDYTHPAFRNADGTTRILGIWDQTVQAGPPPQNFLYGTEYTQADLNQALFSPDPLSIVPVQDEDGHGTAVAGIACGSADPMSDFTGAAPEAGILFVRLKPAKTYLRDYFFVPEGAAAFQENDLMTGVRYLIDCALRLRRPLVICMALGSSQGGHTSSTPLEEVLASAQLISGVYPVTGTGNEAAAAHHFYGKMNSAEEYLDVEILVDAETPGFVVEFWHDPAVFYNVGFLSPLGESVQPTYAGPIAVREFRFLLEDTTIYVYYTTLEMQSGQLLFFIRVEKPSTGIWRLRISPRSATGGTLNLWLPVTGLITPGISFTAPSPDTTLTAPSSAESIISTGTYNAQNNSLYLQSGRGYTRSGAIKPDFAAPGVDLTAPAAGGGYRPVTGSSAASALASGSAAQLAEWGQKSYLSRFLSMSEMKNLFWRGVMRSEANIYPNREWGYGRMNVYQIFENLRGG